MFPGYETRIHLCEDHKADIGGCCGEVDQMARQVVGGFC